jgi:hypothetical protein
MLKLYSKMHFSSGDVNPKIANISVLTVKEVIDSPRI